MKQTVTLPERPLVDEDSELTKSLPLFVTRTTLQDILASCGVDSIQQLSARSGDSMPSNVDGSLNGDVENILDNSVPTFI